MNVPNLLTIMRIALTPLFLAMLFAESWYLRSSAFIIFIVASITDFYDGRLARANGEETEFGRFMDPLADKILVTSALVAFVWSRVVQTWLVAPIVVRDVVITAVRAHSAYHGRPLQTTKLAKWKTVTQLVTVIVILFLIGLQEVVGRFGAERAPEWPWVPVITNSLMTSVLILTLLSGVHYFLRILRSPRRRFLP